MSRLTANFLLLIYLLSGITSLAFEVLWARMLSLQFGVSTFGVAVTVAAFMLGLGLGSLVGTRWQKFSNHPLRMFALLEGSVAIYAMFLPWLLATADAWLSSAAPGVSLSFWFLLQGLTLFLIMLLPAFAMGLGFPLVLRAIHGIVSLGKLYGLNACGGAIGAMLPLLLLPVFGWTISVRLIAILGILIGLSAMLLSMKRGGLQCNDNEEDSVDAEVKARKAIPRTDLLAYAGIGAAAIILEIGWTRLFGMVMLRTEYVLAVVLAVFLIGIGFGSLLSRYLRGEYWMALLPSTAAIVSILTLWAVPEISAWLEQAEFSSLAHALVYQGSVLAVLTLPVTLVMGAWLPLLTRRQDDVMSGAILYGANSVGAAIGAVLCGFVLIPLLGTTLTIIIAALLLFLLGMTWVCSRRNVLLMTGVPLLLVLAWPVSEFMPVQRLLPLAQADSKDLYRYEDAVSITHVVEQRDGQRILLSDLQRMDASSDATAVELQKNQARLALMLHPSPASVLFLGLGTGITASGSLPYAQMKRTAVELSQGSIVAAQKWFKPVNGNVSASLQVEHDDGRRYLKTTEQRFDVVVGDVFHPDLSGRSALLSLEQFERARRVLNEDGIFVQWLALNQFDVESLQVVLRTFKQVFSDGVIFIDGFRIAMVGLNSEQQNKQYLFAQSVQSSLSGLSKAGQSEITGGEGQWTWLARYLGKINVPASAQIQSEWSPSIEFKLPRARYDGKLSMTEIFAWLLGQRPSPEQAANDLGVSRQAYGEFERAYMSSSLAMRSWIAQFNDNRGEALRLLRFAYQANRHDRWTGFALADAMFATRAQAQQQGVDDESILLAILEVRADHVEALRALWQLEIGRGNLAQATSYFDRLRLLVPLDRQISSAEKSQ